MSEKHPHPEWAIAHVLVEWRRTVAPMLRKAHDKCEDGSEEQRQLGAQAAVRIEGFARALRSVA